MNVMFYAINVGNYEDILSLIDSGYDLKHPLGQNELCPTDYVN